MKNHRRCPSRSNDARDLAVCSLVKFAAAVRASLALVGVNEGERFGTRKVFVSAVHAALVNGGHRIELADFKARLVLAKAAGLLRLARADLVSAMPIDAVVASEISGCGETFHFIIDPAAREPWDLGASLEIA